MTRFVKYWDAIEFLDGKKTDFISYLVGGDFHRMVAFLRAQTDDAAGWPGRYDGFDSADIGAASRRYVRKPDSTTAACGLCAAGDSSRTSPDQD